MFSDARDYQILFLLLFLGLGVLTRDWSVQPTAIATVIATCLATQALATALQRHFDTASWAHVTRFNWRSPLITALGLSLLLRVESLWIMVLAGSVAIASKFCLRRNNKHWFNPANLGIIVAVNSTSGAWVSPGQWGEAVWLSLILLSAGGLVLKKVGRWETSLAFLGGYALLEASRNLWLGWTWDVWLHRLCSGSLLIFALFMVTDPRSIPNHQAARILWALLIALVTFILRNQFFLSTAMFWALFALAPLTILFDRLWPQKNFVWQLAPPPPSWTSNA